VAEGVGSVGEGVEVVSGDLVGVGLVGVKAGVLVVVGGSAGVNAAVSGGAGIALPQAASPAMMTNRRMVFINRRIQTSPEKKY
jgi:hypothetical protein